MKILKFLNINMFEYIKHAKKYSTQSKYCSKDTKCYTKSHFISFRDLKYLVKNLQQSTIAHSMVIIPQRTKENCKLVSVYKLTTKYANIPNSAVKNANKSVLQNSIFNFTISSIKRLYLKFKKFVNKGKI